jgi:hypothetical protein
MCSRFRVCTCFAACVFHSCAVGGGGGKHCLARMLRGQGSLFSRACVRIPPTTQRRRLTANPMDVEAQEKLEEIIRLQNVENNRLLALEHTPEVFFRCVRCGCVVLPACLTPFRHACVVPRGLAWPLVHSVEMLYITTEVNGVAVKAFVDSGAQNTIMSKQCAERCGIMRLVDTRFAGQVRRVGAGTGEALGGCSVRGHIGWLPRPWGRVCRVLGGMVRLFGGRIGAQLPREGREDGECDIPGKGWGSGCSGTWMRYWAQWGARRKSEFACWSPCVHALTHPYFPMELPGIWDGVSPSLYRLWVWAARPSSAACTSRS